MQGPCIICKYKFNYMNGDLKPLPRKECSEEEVNLEKCNKYFPQSSKIDLLKFVEKHRGELLLDGMQVVRLIDFKNDENDYYFDLQSLAEGRYWASCVGRLIPLKNRISDEEYASIEHVFNLNIGWTIKAQNRWKEHKKSNKVFVTWDPLYEEVVCVHKNSDSTCEKCRKILSDNRESYHLSVEQYEVQP